MTGTAGPLTVLVVADQQAVADAVSSALAATGLVVATDPDALPLDPAGDGAAVSTVGLLLHALAPEECSAAARALISGTAIPWLVVASTPRGPGWDVALEAGARLVVDAAVTSVDRVGRLLHDLAGGRLAGAQPPAGQVAED